MAHSDKKHPAQEIRNVGGHARRTDLKGEVKALYVEVPVADIERYKQLAKELGNLTMRDLVVRSIEELAQRWRNANAHAQPLEGAGIAFDESMLPPGMRESVATESAAIANDRRAAEYARHRDIAMPELVSIGNRNLQLVDVQALKQRLFEQDARIAALESSIATTDHDVGELVEVLLEHAKPGERHDLEKLINR